MILNRPNYVTRLNIAVICLVVFHCQQHLFVKSFVFMMNQLTLTVLCLLFRVSLAYLCLKIIELLCSSKAISVM